MATNNIGVRFTEEVYASRSQVAHTLGTNLIDPFWNQIISYRKNYEVDLNLKDISKMSYFITLCKTINDKTIELTEKIDRYSKTYNEKITNSLNKNNYHHDNLKKELMYVAKANKILVNDVAINNIIYHKSSDPMFQTLINYLSAAEFVYSNSNNAIDEEFLANLYGLVTGEKELSSFYRTNELNSFSQKVIINREYAGAPVNQIEDYMDMLFDFINNYNASLIVKAAVVYYMVNYIKPFEKYNAEISILLVRKILSSKDNSHLFVPIGSLLSEKQDEITLAIRESQRSRDLTYVLVQVMDILSSAFQSSLDSIALLLVEGAQQSYLMGEDEQKIKEEFGDVKTSKEEYTLKEEPKVIVEAKPQPEQKVVASKKISVSKQESTNKENTLSDRELKQKAEDLLESDPMLRPNQAHFYVRHCTIGHYYTIQQYKKCEHCVYETARTSMDNLAKQGYYKREQVKNKFVYTPLLKD